MSIDLDMGLVYEKKLYLESKRSLVGTTQIKQNLEKLNKFYVHKAINVHKQLKNQEKVPPNWCMKI